MTLAQIMKLALRQLDEDPADIAEYEELFKVYANTGYQILLRSYYKPKATMQMQTDEDGAIYIDGMGIVRVASVSNEHGMDVWFDISQDGEKLLTSLQDAQVTVVYEEEMPDLDLGNEPNLPAHAHPALVDYICYRHLSTGNLAKQSRAEFFRQNFYAQAQQLRPKSGSGVRQTKNLYAATSIRSGR